MKPMKPCVLVAVVVASMFRPATAWCAAGPLQRYALVVGANFGGVDRPRLQYAISDAERFARVMVDIGGVLPANEIVLRQPKLRELIDALDQLTRRVAEARATAGRTEVILYYSGHADEQGLLIGDDRYGYRSLRERLDQMPADVRIAVLDACSSGAFTRVKGGKARPPFLVDESSAMRGHAFLTSSAESEAAQESDRIRASYFTHYLLSGFRGAADLSGDGKVTLSEAYQFAFSETLGRTVDTKGGAQHPSYDINLSGTGDVVMTDVRQMTATLVLGEDLEGRFFVRTRSQDLVVELYKPAGRRVELAVEPGPYEIRIERAQGVLLAKADVADGARVVLEPREFVATTLEPTRRRGDALIAPLAVAGRNRFELRTGMWRSNHIASIVAAENVFDAFAGIQYTRYISENLAATFSIDAIGVQEGSVIGPAGVFTGTVGGLLLPVGVRWKPFLRDHRGDVLWPFVTAGVGPIIATAEGSFVSRNSVSAGTTTRGTFGGYVGAGLDLHLARSFSLGMTFVYNGMADFSEPVGLRNNFNGVQVALGIGWLWGRGTAIP